MAEKRHNSFVLDNEIYKKLRLMAVEMDNTQSAIICGLVRFAEHGALDSDPTFRAKFEELRDQYLKKQN